MEKLPHNLNRGQRLTARFVNELVRRVERLENTKYNPEQFQQSATATGMTRSLSPDFLRRIAKGTGTSATTARFGYVTATTETPMVVVQFLNYAIAPVGDVDQIAWTKEGEPRPAWLQPNAKPEDVKELKRATFDAKSPVVRLDRINSVWFATWLPRWSVIKLPTDKTIVRCSDAVP